MEEYVSRLSLFLQQGYWKGSREQPSHKKHKSQRRSEGVLLSSVHPCCGVDGRANPRYFVMLRSATVVCQAAVENEQEEGLGDKSSFHGLCCLCSAHCWRKSLVHMASLWGRWMPPAVLQPGLKASLGSCTHGKQFSRLSGSLEPGSDALNLCSGCEKGGMCTGLQASAPCLPQL